MGKQFEENVLRLLDETEEVEIETVSPDTQERHRTTIWIVVVGSYAYLRSVSGEKGHWYQHLRASSTGTIHVNDQSVPVQAASVKDLQLQHDVSEAYWHKYGHYPQDTEWITAGQVLPTTLRLELASQ